MATIIFNLHFSTLKIIHSLGIYFMQAKQFNNNDKWQTLETEKLSIFRNTAKKYNLYTC
jgi:hypothetical protein